MNFRRFCMVRAFFLGMTVILPFQANAQEESAIDPRLQKMSPDMINRLAGAETVEDFTAAVAKSFRSVAGRDGTLNKEGVADRNAAEDARQRSDVISKLLDNDLNGDGSLTRDEVMRTVAMRQGARNGGAAVVQKAEEKAIRKIMLADGDGDGTISFAEMLVEAGNVVDTRADGRETARADALMAFDSNADGVVTLQEVRAGAPRIFALIDLDGDELLGETERAAFQLQAEQIRKRQFEDALMANCDFVRPTPEQQIAVLAVGRGLEIPRVSLAGPAETTWSAALTIEAGTAPLWLLVSADDPMLWRLEGATNRIARLVVVPGQRNDLPAAGVIGLAPEKIEFVHFGKCQLQRILGEDRQRIPETMTRLLGRSPDGTVSASTFFAASLPSGEIVKKQPPTVEISNNIPLDGWQKAQGFGSAPIIEVDPTHITATMKVETYDVLPQESGIAQLVKEGSILPRPLKSFVAADNTPLLMATQYRGYLFEIVKPIPHFPAGLTGSHAVTFVLAKEVPMPAGDPGQSCILDGATGKPLNRSPICRRD